MKQLLIFFLTITTVAHSQVVFNVPEIEVPVSEYINLPVEIETSGEIVGSLEFALNFDSQYLEFEEIIVTTKAQEWLTYTQDWEGETVRWGGYDASFGDFTISNTTELFTVRFKVIKDLVYNNNPIKKFLLKHVIDVIVPYDLKYRIKISILRLITKKDTKTAKKQPKNVIDNQTKLYLYELLEEDISNLEKLLNKDLSHWKLFN